LQRVWICRSGCTAWLRSSSRRCLGHDWATKRRLLELLGDVFADNIHGRTEERGMRVRQAGWPERMCGQQLVVGDKQRTGRVVHVHAAGREPLKLAGAALDAVEDLVHLEPGEGDIPRLEGLQRRCGSSNSESSPQARAAATSASFAVGRRGWARCDPGASAQYAASRRCAGDGSRG
jgi:hypothetical protein